MGSLGLGGHQVQEEGNSDDAVIWDVTEDEAEEHLDGLEEAEHGPEGKPHVGCVIAFGFDGLDGLNHGVQAGEQDANDVVTLGDHSDQQEE